MIQLIIKVNFLLLVKQLKKKRDLIKNIIIVSFSKKFLEFIFVLFFIIQHWPVFSMDIDNDWKNKESHKIQVEEIKHEKEENYLSIKTRSSFCPKEEPKEDKEDYELSSSKENTVSFEFYLAGKILSFCCFIGYLGYWFIF